MKTYANWSGNGRLNEYLKVGDVVDGEMANHFRRYALQKDSTRIIQIEDAYQKVEGKEVYYTIENTDKGWVYRGCCYAGEFNRP